ncbi:MAG: hypothetical protein WD077_05810 [Bacteroidia bacterium]
MIWFINGKIGFGSPPAGRIFWGRDDEFVQGAAKFFDDPQMKFPPLDFKFLSTCRARYALGYEFGREKLLEISTTEGPHHLVGFSMGCAFAEGMAEAFGEEGVLGKTVHINAFQAAHLEVKDRTRFVVEYQLEDDPVINNKLLSLLGIARPGKIQGTTMSFTEKSGFLVTLIVHRSPIWHQKGRFWENLSQLVREQINAV